MMDVKPTFGVVVLNWNGLLDTIACLESLRAADPGPARVIVVDNGSSDASVAQIKKWGRDRGVLGALPADSWLVLIEANTNRGFAGGSNLGIRFLVEQTDISHVMLLNNDATVTPSFFSDISSALDRVPDAGLITGTILEYSRRDKVWYAGGVELPYRALVKHKLTVPDSPEPVATDFVSGCAMIISRPLIARVGMLAECYFPGYWEDGEYSFRARHAGFPVMYAPAAIAYHKVGGTVGPANQSTFVSHGQNRLRVFYVRRNYRGLTKVIALTYLAFTKPGRAVIEALKGRPRIGWAILSGTIAGFASSAPNR
ncbi:MAG TPA: glycosyltransferase family 2 protein [Gemmatimonadaceae bacterium]|nr:glycosyltransferase family 2 protein [Gemmatimonadaceae bacterium]